MAKDKKDKKSFMDGLQDALRSGGARDKVPAADGKKHDPKWMDTKKKKKFKFGRK